MHLNFKYMLFVMWTTKVVLFDENIICPKIYFLSIYYLNKTDFFIMLTQQHIYPSSFCYYLAFPNGVSRHHKYIFGEYFENDSLIKILPFNFFLVTITLETLLLNVKRILYFYETQTPFRPRRSLKL